MIDSKRIKISKALSWLLRHNAENIGLFIRPDGFIKISEVLDVHKIKSLNADLKIIENIVQTSDKQRFELKQIMLEDGNTEMFIRAVQGHSIKSVKEEGLMEEIKDPNAFEIVVHGTYAKNWKSIYVNGLKKMTRNHIHLAPGYPGEGQVISGMRGSCNTYIEIDIKKAIAEGIKFYISKNNAILTAGLDGILQRKYFSHVFVNQKEVFSNKNNLLEYLCVLDFEANCTEEKNVLKCQEIIEFPVVLLHLKTNTIIDIFHTYVKPVIHPEITQFCTDLTGISQEQVDNGILLSEAINNLEIFLTKHNIKTSKFTFVTCGDWDLNTCLKKESMYKNIIVPEYLSSYINLKKVFPLHLYKEEEYKEIKNIKRAHPVVQGMLEMLELTGIKLEGKHHSGIDDTKNITSIIIRCINDGFSFSPDYILYVKYPNIYKEKSIAGALSEEGPKYRKVGEEVKLDMEMGEGTKKNRGMRKKKGYRKVETKEETKNTLQKDKNEEVKEEKSTL